MSASKHPEVLWAQRSSETDKEKVIYPPQVIFSTRVHPVFTWMSPLFMLFQPIVTSRLPQLERSIRDHQPSRYR